MTPLQKLKSDFAQMFPRSVLVRLAQENRPDVIVNFFTTRFTQILNNIEGEIEGLKIKSVEDVAVDTHNYALDAVKSIIQKHRQQ